MTNPNEMIQYASYLVTVIGVMAFLVSAITQVIKSWPGLEQIPTSAVVIVLSLVLCPVVFIAAMTYLGHAITWYMIVGCIILAFIIALVAMDGWERVQAIWARTAYKKEITKT